MSNKKATNPPLPIQKDDEGKQLGERWLNSTSLKT